LSSPDTWPPLRWKLLALAFWIAAAIFFVVVFNFWPDIARSTIFRVSSFVVISVLALVFFKRPKIKN
jgi:hypothetical protein